MEDPEVRRLFTKEHLLESDWYAARLKAKQSFDRQLWERHTKNLEKFLKRSSHALEAERLGIADRLESAKRHSARVNSPEYLEQLRGTIGVEPITGYLASKH